MTAGPAGWQQGNLQAVQQAVLVVLLPCGLYCSAGPAPLLVLLQLLLLYHLVLPQRLPLWKSLLNFQRLLLSLLLLLPLHQTACA